MVILIAIAQLVIFTDDNNWTSLSQLTLYHTIREIWLPFKVKQSPTLIINVCKVNVTLPIQCQLMMLLLP